MDLGRLLTTAWDRGFAIVLILVGGVVMFAGWYGVSGTPFPAAQMSYLVSGGLGGIFFLGVGATLWLSADLRDEWSKLDRIEQRLAEDAATGALSSSGPWSGMHDADGPTVPRAVAAERS